MAAAMAASMALAVVDMSAAVPTTGRSPRPASRHVLRPAAPRPAGVRHSAPLTTRAASDDDRFGISSTSGYEKSGFMEKDSAGQSNVFAIEPEVYEATEDRVSPDGVAEPESVALLGAAVVGGIAVGLVLLSKATGPSINDIPPSVPLAVTAAKFAKSLASIPAIVETEVVTVVVPVEFDAPPVSDAPAE